MKIIVLSSPIEVLHECRLITALFSEGLEFFHLRKPDFQKDEMERMLEKIPACFHSQIIIHSHFELAGKFSLKGVHIKQTDFPVLPLSRYRFPKHISTSFHSVREIRNFRFDFTYSFLSPVFDSISKAGYKSKFSLSSISLLLKQPVMQEKKIIALGGVDENKIEMIKTAGFAGFALLGAIWQSTAPVEKFKRIKKLAAR